MIKRTALFPLNFFDEIWKNNGLKCEHCYKYLDKSIDELTKSYNQRLNLEETQLESDINEEIDEDSCELEETDSYKSKVRTDSELQKRILVYKSTLFANSRKTLQDITYLPNI
ncbi:hypothetical protein GLOIN_2v1778876 [Rhizophagus clarus]|uniref:Uncharacterized protein n=1 Tax=Rhizophagus clarus TaxID=94130 RepID=A0A8H3QBB5_9GLOM|nr:hypothetical protein GLOIN_2v1778876 [Rhizophagus clarus]